MDQPVSSAFRPVITHVEVPPGMLRPEHFDHAGGLAEVTERAPQAVVRAGAADLSEIRLEGRAVEPLDEADRVRDLVVLETPGHAPGHLSLLDEANSLILVGDAVGNVGDGLSFGPPAFTADQGQARASSSVSPAWTSSASVSRMGQR